MEIASTSIACRRTQKQRKPHTEVAHNQPKGILKRSKLISASWGLGRKRKSVKFSESTYKSGVHSRNIEEKWRKYVQQQFKVLQANKLKKKQSKMGSKCDEEMHWQPAEASSSTATSYFWPFGASSSTSFNDVDEEDYLTEKMLKFQIPKRGETLSDFAAVKPKYILDLNSFNQLMTVLMSILCICYTPLSSKNRFIIIIGLNIQYQVG